MKEYVVRVGDIWARVSVDMSVVRVSYQPAFQREGMRMKVVDYEGVEIDSFDLKSGHPPERHDTVWEQEVDEPDEVSEWIAAHLQAGIIGLSGVGDVVDQDGAMMVLDGGRYDLAGVEGRLVMKPTPMLVTFEGEHIPVEPGEAWRLFPMGASVRPIEVEQL